METVQVQDEATRAVHTPLYAAVIKLLNQVTRKPLPGGNHVRAGITKSKGLGESKARRKMAKMSRKRNRAR